MPCKQDKQDKQDKQEDKQMTVLLGNKRYNVLGMDMTRDELIRFLCEYIDEYQCADKVRNILPQYTVLRNVMHHPVKIAKELGLLYEIKES